jgi:hypothetical protein
MSAIVLPNTFGALARALQEYARERIPSLEKEVHLAHHRELVSQIARFTPRDSGEFAEKQASFIGPKRKGVGTLAPVRDVEIGKPSFRGTYSPHAVIIGVFGRKPATYKLKARRWQKVGLDGGATLRISERATGKIKKNRRGTLRFEVRKRWKADKVVTRMLGSTVAPRGTYVSASEATLYRSDAITAAIIRRLGDNGGLVRR